jgi:hypothetical protein
MSQTIDPSISGGGNALPANLNPSAALRGNYGNSYATSNPNAALPSNGTPLLGDMRGYDGDGFQTSSPSEQNLAALLNIEPLQQQVNQMSGGATEDPSQSLNYVNKRIAPIMTGAQQTYEQAMANASQKK